jgi:hypothetical protein
MLDAEDSLLLQCGPQIAVHQQGGGRIAMKGVKT